MPNRYEEAKQPGVAVSIPSGASTAVVTADRDRAKISVTNDSDSVIYLRLAATGATSAAACGVRLAPAATWSEDTFTGPICAFQSAGTAKNLIVYEV